MTQPHLTIAVGIATAGRREVLAEVIEWLGKQDTLPDEFLICPASEADVDLEGLAHYPKPIRVVPGPTGLPAQRNTLLAATQADVIVFFDDDYVPKTDFIEETRRFFQAHPRAVVATGYVLADGILGPGLSLDESLAILRADKDFDATEVLDDTYNAYGCNMALRMAPVREHALRFDEMLPFYAWLEDVDFCRQLAPHGAILKTNRLRGVHMGTKRSGRSSGRRLGYSQVANPVYLARKGTMEWQRATSQICRNIAANALKSFRAEPWIDRKGRLQGNLQALRDLLTSRISPMNITKF
ncbi:Glycosyltransferase, GT2 family [Pseudoxanthomonas sp. GM95]|uniref:glycosyltransferase family 2 protein n=1 Tax=Pseudoxanthomonas sp. GM95 TaxID=1881043 RepID=UPI0008B5F02A|nr:glycosyltransferase family 2 protein [Pseudoxanthomonas sp. GM95]SEM45379.1 Glycosyltransferase, GT2 family [Pseudoxanthomonas sp. GM95]